MIVAGFGFRRAASAESLMDALNRAGNTVRVDVFATHADKATARCFSDLAAQNGRPVVAVDADRIGRQRTKTMSPASIAMHGTGSVAEAAALAAAGSGSRLIATRVVSQDGLATCALAEGNGL